MSAWRMVDRRWATTKLVRPLQQFFQGVLDARFGHGVDGAGGFIENEDARVGEHGAGEADELALAERQAAAAFADLACTGRRA